MLSKEEARQGSSTTTHGRRRRVELRTLRAQQILFLVLLGVSVALVLWWLLDQTRYSKEVRDRLLLEWQSDLTVAQRWLDQDPERASELREIFPHLEITLLSSREAEVRLLPSAVAGLYEARRRHIRQYASEGSFFLVVLLSLMAVLWRVLRREAELRHRQQNFLAAVSHELKSPLASLRLTAETMALRDPPLERRRSLLDRILSELGRLETLVGNLLETTRIEEGRLELKREAFALRPLVTHVVDELSVGVDGCVLRLDVAEEIELFLDPTATRMVIRNLLENAIKASEGCAVREVDISARDEGDKVTLIVRDQGVGFPAEEGPRLFEKFYRPGDEMRRRTRGTGLGLYLVDRFVRLEGGTVTAHSEGPGHGAEFAVSWPTAEKTAVPSRVEESPGARE